MSITPYIELGWHTVPLKGELRRLDDGSKTIPIFEDNWRLKYTETKNTKATDIGGAITGLPSQILAIDCDNDATWKLFIQLANQKNDFLFRSKGKEGGTLVYKYSDRLPHTFSVIDNTIKLDFYSNNGFVYLPTLKNTSKIPLNTPLPELQTIPESIITLLNTLYTTTKVQNTNINNNNDNLFTANFLNPLVTQFVTNKGQYMPGLFRIITPKQFRTYDNYVKYSHLHPNDIFDGEGSTYLVQVSAILGADHSIDEELYHEAMLLINALFDDPLPSKRLDATIIDPMLSNHKLWRYSEDWENYRALFLTKDQSTLETVYDDDLQVYYVVDESREQYSSFVRDSEFYNHLYAVTATDKNKRDIIKTMPLVTTVTKPNKPFGFSEGEDSNKRVLNLFKSTPALSVFYNPEDYTFKYKYPETTIKYLKTLIPHKEVRDYLLSFIKTKLTTFNYSPVIIFFLGVSGSGKSMFVELLSNVIGDIPSPSAKEFLEKYNKFMMGSYFVELDEYGNSVSTYKEKQELIGKLNSITGKKRVSVRMMQKDSFKYEHNVTFIATANSSPFMIQDNERRLLLIDTPNVLVKQDWVQKLGGVDRVYDSMMESVHDFCYWLATEVKPLTNAQYVSPPMFEGKFELIADSMPAAARLTYALKEKEVDYIKQLASDYELSYMNDELDEGVITVDSLYDLYQEMTEGRGVRRSLMKVLREEPNLSLEVRKDNKQCISGFKKDD